MRVRDIIHQDGARLRLTFDPAAVGGEPLLRLVDPSQCGDETILLDLHGSELLAAFLMSARLAAPTGGLANEGCNGDYPVSLALTGSRGGHRAVEIQQLGQIVRVPPSLWDRLYAELLLVVAHGRRMIQARPSPALQHPQQPRLLH